MSDQKGNDGEDDDKAAVRPSHPPQQDSVTFPYFGPTQLLRLFLCGAVWNVLEPFHFLNLFFSGLMSEHIQMPLLSSIVKEFAQTLRHSQTPEILCKEKKL